MRKSLIAALVAIVVGLTTVVVTVDSDPASASTTIELPFATNHRGQKVVRP